MTWTDWERFKENLGSQGLANTEKSQESTVFSWTSELLSEVCTQLLKSSRIFDSLNAEDRRISLK